jgi:hypothetical protein
MPARALLVLLVMLNVGVATWWLLRPGPSAPVAWTQPADVPRLQLLGETVAQPGGRPEPAAAVGPDRPLDQRPAADGDAAGGTGSDGDGPDATGPAPPAGSPPIAAATADAAGAIRCTSFGPFSDAASVAGARSALQPLGAVHMRVRDVVEAPRGWRVAMAPQADRAAADALAAKIRSAGFDDLLVVPSGEEANAIALGRYGSESAARRRESTLRAAGFPARAQPLGDAATRHWLDIAWGPGFDVATARRAAAAPQMQDIDCATVVDPAARR